MKDSCFKNIMIFLCIITLISCGTEPVETGDKRKQQQIFVDVTEQSGIDFKHVNGMNGNLYFIEMMGASSAFFDFDNDGDLDIYLGQGGKLNNNSTDFGVLYRNDLELGHLKFTNVTQKSGLISNEYNMGIAIGDINNDGYADVYLTNFGTNQMFLNNKDGTFIEVTDQTNTHEKKWSTSAAFFDMDGDNWLDLYVANYVDYSIETHKVCVSPTGLPEYCGPNAYPSEKDTLFKNKGNGKFENQTNAKNILLKGAGLGVVTGDYNLDGKQDVYVTNDMGHNFMWVNSNNDIFDNHGLKRGSAVNKHGKSEASMGVDAGDFDNDGDLDLFMTHLLNETNTIYENNGNGYFKDSTSIFGLAEPSKGYTGFGTAFLDYDNDGWLDIIAINGAVRQIQKQIDEKIKLPLEQSNQLFRNNKSFFTETTTQAEVLSIQKVSRGTAIGDIDNDGDTDILITNNNARPQLLLNQVGNQKYWIGLSLVDSKGKFMLGSTARIKLQSGLEITRRSHTDASYISANDPRILIGLDKSHENIDVTINWSDGTLTNWNKLKVNQYHNLVHPNL